MIQDLDDDDDDDDCLNFLKKSPIYGVAACFASCFYSIEQRAIVFIAIKWFFNHSW